MPANQCAMAGLLCVVLERLSKKKKDGMRTEAAPLLCLCRGTFQDSRVVFVFVPAPQIGRLSPGLCSPLFAVFN